MPFKFNPFTGKLDAVNVNSGGTVTNVTATSPIVSSGGTTPNISIPQANASTNGYLSAADWNTFNDKLDSSFGNYITNPDAEVDTSGWNLYNDAGNTASAYVVAQDITFTAVAVGDAGNGININYQFHATQSYLTPLVTVVSPTLVTVAWYNGPTIANNPTATQLKAAWDAVPGAVALATAAITGTAGHLQYITGANVTGNGGDSHPVDGTGGSVTGVTFTRNTSTPLVGTASFDLGKDAASREGTGVSTDFTINNLDKGQTLQISFAYQGSSGMVLGSASDVRVFLYDITAAAFIGITSVNTLAGPTGTAKTYEGQFVASSTNVNYRLILHIATANAVAWDLLIDKVVVNDSLTAADPTQVESLVLPSQPITGAVTDHMVVMWRDATSAWQPATIAGAAIPVFGTDTTVLGFATNIIGLTADIFVSGYMGGFSFGPFAGYSQYIDNTAGSISPLPSPFTDTYVSVGKAVGATVLNIQFAVHVDQISNGSGTPIKGGLLTSSAVNDGTGDIVLSPGSNGNVLVANSGATPGLSWAPAVVASAPFTYTTATRTLTIATATNSVAGVMSAADHALLHNAVTIGTANGLSLSTQVLSLAAATNSVPGALTAADHTAFAAVTGAVTSLAAIGASPNANAGSIAANVLTLQPASASFGGVVTTAAQTFAGVKTLPTPIFTGDTNFSTGNALISTIGKGLQIKTGTNAKIGTAVLVAGTVTVANTSVTANSRIFLTSNVDGGTVGFLRVSAKTAATSFVITSSSVLDTSTVAWMIVESIP